MGSITVNNLGKAYKRYRKKSGRLLEWIGLGVHHDLVWVLRDVTFQVSPGESVGIIGINGAGKSTLLKIISGIVKPTTGIVEVSGRVSALLELGMGFHPDFTGRENVYMAGQLKGLTREQITGLMPEIEAFAEIGDYIDQPVRVYSSGMQVRLAFSVATAVRPDILIVDEALSVGDSYFQHKSFDRIRKFRDDGVSILFVTHAVDMVRTLCDRGILIDQGRIIKDGYPDEVVDYYNAFIAAKENAKLDVEQRREKGGWLLTRSGTGEARIKNLQLLDADSGQEVAVAQVGQKLELRVEVCVQTHIPRLVLGIMIRDKLGHVIWGTNTWHTHQVLENLKAGETLVFYVPFTCALGPGSYSVSPALVSSDTHLVNNYEWIDNLLVFDVINADKNFFIGTNWIDAQFHIYRGIEEYAK